MDRDEIIECAKALLPWHYDFEIVEGVRTHSLNDPKDPNHTMILALDPQRIVPIFKRLYPEGLAGKDVLDIGCNAGGYCFLAAELGARSAVGFDIRQHWLNQAALIHRTKYPELKNVAFKIGDAKTALKDFGSVGSDGSDWSALSRLPEQPREVAQPHQRAAARTQVAYLSARRPALVAAGGALRPPCLALDDAVDGARQNIRPLTEHTRCDLENAGTRPMFDRLLQQDSAGIEFGNHEVHRYAERSAVQERLKHGIYAFVLGQQRGMNVQAGMFGHGERGGPQALIEKCAHQQVRRALGQKFKTKPVVDVAGREHARRR
jgi:SAM-dependent methyltransferase